MSTSAIFCPKCGTRIATINKGGAVRPLPGTTVSRIFAHYALLQCQCGCERKVRHPEQRAA